MIAAYFSVTGPFYGALHILLASLIFSIVAGFVIGAMGRDEPSPPTDPATRAMDTSDGVPAGDVS